MCVMFSYRGVARLLATVVGINRPVASRMVKQK